MTDHPLRRSKEFIYISLVLISMGLVIWQHVGMNTHLIVPVSQRSALSMLNDDINGGQSVGRIAYRDGAPSLECQTRTSGTFAFCSLVINLNNGRQDGIDLRPFDTLTLELDYRSSQRDTLLVYLLNKELHNKTRLSRANMQTLLPTQQHQTYRLSMRHFQIPSWWIFSQSEDVATDVNLNNVDRLQISTGDNSNPRKVEFDIHSVTFSGKWVSAQTLYLSILVGWLLVALIQLSVSARRMQQNYRVSRQRAVDLEGINTFLKIERDKFETLAKRDALTGCLNRNGVRDVLNQVLQHYKKFNQQSTLILFDIDHFKKVNDRFGHEEGDVILKSLAQLVRKHIRDSDHFVRWGGEEFLIVSEQTSLMGGISLAEHLREQITNAKLSAETNITASFGVAPLNSTAIDQWFRQADEALYDAKAQGRNCVVAYSSS